MSWKLCRHRIADLALLCFGFVLAFLADACLTSITRRPPQAAGYPSFRFRSGSFHHGLKPSSDTLASFGPLTYSMRTNSLGLRDATPRRVELRPKGRRLLFIGDSFTEGIGCGFDRTFVGLIGRRLAPRGVDVQNAGVTSYYPGIYLRKVRHLIQEVGLRFDELIVFIDISDIQDETEYQEIRAGDGRTVLRHRQDPPPDGGGPYARARGFIAGHTTVVDWLLRRLGRLRPGRPPEAPPAVLGRPRALWTLDERLWREYGKEGLARATSHMDELARLLETSKIKLTIVVYPWPDQIAKRDSPSRQETHWREWATRHRAGFIDLFPRFLEPPAETALQAYFIPGDVHWSDAGHKLVADEFLRARGERAGARP